MQLSASIPFMSVLFPFKKNSNDWRATKIGEQTYYQSPLHPFLDENSIRK